MVYENDVLDVLRCVLLGLIASCGKLEPKIKEVLNWIEITQDQI